MSLQLTSRPRRNRKSLAIRALCRETLITPADFIYPLFIHENRDDQEIASMPGCKRFSLEGLLKEAKEARSLGINAIVLFPAIENSLKSKLAEESYNQDGLVQRAVRTLKESIPELIVITDVALDPYSSDGHDGLLADDGRILNDETVEILSEQAISHARAGADIVSPSDMMDGRVAAIREALDAEGFIDTSILSYTAKYASAFYGPFRGALDSAPRSGDKKTYQMDPANVSEALRELELDEAEGADIVMVKPAGVYLDIISLFKEHTTLPVAAYQVSGEYLMLKAASNSGWLDEKSAVLESVTAIKRAGADIIVSYYAKEIARWLQK